MPKIFEYFGYVFFFYSNEHEPIHVHVIHGERQLIYELILENGELKSVVRRNEILSGDKIGIWYFRLNLSIPEFFVRIV